MLRATAYLCITFGLYSHYAFATVIEFHVHIKNHLFFPSTIAVPSSQKVKLVIHNQDDTPEEFDSFALNREKVIFANSKATIFIGPLLPGEYNFFGEYHPNTAQGKVIVTESTRDNANVD